MTWGRWWAHCQCCRASSRKDSPSYHLAQTISTRQVFAGWAHTCYLLHETPHRYGFTFWFEATVFVSPLPHCPDRNCMRKSATNFLVPTIIHRLPVLGGPRKGHGIPRRADGEVRRMTVTESVGRSRAERVNAAHRRGRGGWEEEHLLASCVEYV